jgi:hypothetical protein
MYVYAYLRSENGYGNECNLITYPLDYAASVSIGLTFLEIWNKNRPRWLAKDVIILFYEDT